MFKVSRAQLQEILSSALTEQPQDSMAQFKSTKIFEDSLKSNIGTGLSNNEITQRQQIFGINGREIQDSINFLQAFWIISIKPKSIFFLALSIIAFILKYQSTRGIYTNEWIESLVIFGLILLNAIIAAVHLKIADEKNQQLFILEEQQQQVKVLRNGVEETKIARDIVVGDIVLIQQGDKIYVDGLIVEQQNLQINESYFTGDYNQVQKITLEEANQQKQQILPQNHLVFAKSVVIQGNAKILVLAVGADLQANKILVRIDQEEGQTDVQQAIDNISTKMETLGFVGAIIVIFMLLARYMIQYYHSNVNGYSTFSNILNLIIVLISGNSSKALKTHFQIQLAQTVNLMLYNQNLVRKIQSLEKLPFMNQIVFDKTGTLTQNTMVVESFLNDTVEDINPSKFNNFPKEFQQAFIDCCFINNSYDPYTEQGSQLEKGLFELSKKMQINLDERKQQVTHVIPFNSSRKRLTTIIENNRVVVRGAADMIFQWTTKFYSLKSGIIAIDDFQKDNLEQNLIQLSQEGRTIAIAYRDIDLNNENIKELIENNKFEFDRQDLTLLGFLLFSDPLRYDAKRSIECFKQAGVKIVMVTGDNQITAKNIAIKAGIMSLESVITEGTEFTQRIKNKTENYKKEIDDIQVISRARPEDKYNLVNELQELGYVVGVCGDGTNDAPALSKADIGFSLGISGTEAARESSGIILLDDNVYSAYKGLIFARNLLDSIKRLAQYQITSHFSLIIILIASSAIGDAVISPLQFIWINLITDLFATFALSYCAPSQNLYHQKPPNKNGFLLDKIVYIHIVILSIYIVAVCFIFVNQSLMVFNLFVMTTLFNLINSRMVYLELNVFKGFFGSWMIQTSILIIGLLQYLIVEYGGTVMQTFDGLSFKQWLICVAIGIGSIVWRSLAILIIRPIFKSDSKKVKVS